MAFWQWLKSPALSNGNSDPTINWVEGMSPSGVNDSARAMMARMAEWRDDVSGALLASGSSTAYSIATNQGFSSLAVLHNAMLCFVPNITNGPGATTLSVDGLAAAPIRPIPGQNVQSGTLIQGTPYVVTYNNVDGAFYLDNLPNIYGVPVGSVLWWTGGNVAPNSAYALPFGQQISQTTYANLYSIVGPNAYGTDSGGNFFLPDLRDRAIFGLDNMNGTPAGRITVAGGAFDGTILGNSGGVQNHVLAHAEFPNVNFTISGITLHDPQHSHGYGVSGINGSSGTPGVSGNAVGTTISTNAASTGLTVSSQGTANSGGSGNTLSILCPAMSLPFIIRVI